MIENQEIDIVNNIIAQAIVHGADCGGSYESNKEGLEKAIFEWLEYRDSSDCYEVVDCYTKIRGLDGIWPVLQIARRY